MKCNRVVPHVPTYSS